MLRSYIPVNDRKFVFKRANRCCEYCKSPADYSTEPFSIEHIIPIAKNGLSELSNYALSCLGCNYHKSIKIEIVELISQKITPLFNPRTMIWNEHFVWDETSTIIIGKTAIGRATIQALKLNRQQIKNLRRALIAIDEHPPK
jgi:HNH endonuclease